MEAFFQALTNFQSGKANEAISLLNDCEERTPRWWLTYARCLAAGESFEEILELCASWSEHAPDCQTPRFLKSAALEEPAERVPIECLRETFDIQADWPSEFLYSDSELLVSLIGDKLGTPPEEPGWRALDAGCGIGNLAHVLKPYAEELIGVDVSPVSLKKAESIEQYDKLIQADFVSWLQSTTQRTLNFIVAANSLQYLGNLNEFVSAAFQALHPEGWLIFNVDQGPLDSDSFQLQRNGSFTHSPPYLMEVLGSNGIAGGSMLRTKINRPGNTQVPNLLVAVQNPASDATE